MQVTKVSEDPVESGDLYAQVLNRPHCAAIATFLPAQSDEDGDDDDAVGDERENWSSEEMVQTQIFSGALAFWAHAMLHFLLLGM